VKLPSNPITISLVLVKVDWLDVEVARHGVDDRCKM
jgi:hypothetical protein